MMGGDNSEDGELRCLAVCGFTLLGICLGSALDRNLVRMAFWWMAGD